MKTKIETAAPKQQSPYELEYFKLRLKRPRFFVAWTYSSLIKFTTYNILGAQGKKLQKRRKLKLATIKFFCRWIRELQLNNMATPLTTAL